MENNNQYNSLPEITEKQKAIHSIIFPAFFFLVIWIIKIIEYEMDYEFYYFGIYPLKIEGLVGIIFSPLIHSNFNHLIDNSVTLFVLSMALFYFYRPIQYKIFFLSYILTGFFVWIVGRPSYHIGASGLIYGLASFIFFSGIIRKDVRLMAISFAVVFLYGSLIWGIFPIKKSISWESHLWGGISGVILAVYFRKYGPQRKKFDWEDEDDEDDEEDELDEGVYQFLHEEDDKSIIKRDVR